MILKSEELLGWYFIWVEKETMPGTDKEGETMGP
jgi:hypothetical protein